MELGLLLYILALVCGLTAVIASLIYKNWFAAIGFLGIVLIAIGLVF